MIYIPQRPLFNRYIAITILSNVPSIMVLVLVPFLFTGHEHPLLSIGIMFTLYRAGNILGSYIGPKITSWTSPEKLLSSFEVLNFLISSAFVLLIHFEQNLYLPMALLFFLKGAVAGLHNNNRFQWLKSLSTKTSITSKIVVYTHSIVQAAFGFGGVLIFLQDRPDLIFCRNVFILDLVTSAVSAFLFLGMNAERIVKPKTTGPKIDWSAFFKKTLHLNLASTDFFIAFTVAGMNILILKFGSSLTTDSNGYAIALMIYALSYLAGSYIVNELNPQRVKLIYKVSAFAVFSVGMWLLPPPYNVISFFLFFLLYPVLLLGLEKAWFEAIDGHVAGIFHARRIILLSFIWAIGEIIYADTSLDMQIRSISGAFALCSLLMTLFWNFEKKRL